MISLLRKFANLFSVDIAMDLGTANILLYTRRHGLVINEPSVVALDVRTNKPIAIGLQAKNYLGRVPPYIRVVRPLKQGVIADFDITCAMISYFTHKAIKTLSLIKPSMSICIPSGITQVEKKAVIDVALQTGARNVNLIEEPMAAAIGANLPINEPIGNMVLDIGGGTSEVAVITLGGLAIWQSVRVAGDVMNLAVQRYLREVFHLEVGESTSENVKIILGSAIPQKSAPSLAISGRDIARGCPHSVTVNEGHIREALQDALRAILNAVLRALERTPPELAADIYSNGLLLTGGGSLLKGLDSYLSKEIRLKVFVDEDPLTTVLRGTAKAMLYPDIYKSVFIN